MIVRVVSLDATCLLVLLFIPTKYYQNMSKGIKVMEHTRVHVRMDGQTDGQTYLQACEVIPLIFL